MNSSLTNVLEAILAVWLSGGNSHGALLASSVLGIGCATWPLGQQIANRIVPDLVDDEPGEDPRFA